MYIYGANGPLLLNIPIRHTGKKDQHQKYKDVKIESTSDWKKQHWKSLQSAYRSSPFFEFYEDEFAALYHREFRFLLDFNYSCLDLTLDCLDLSLDSDKSTEYILNPESATDARKLADAKSKKEFKLEPYPQVFNDRYGFLSNLGIVDLIFNEGPNAADYLRRQTL